MRKPWHFILYMIILLTVIIGCGKEDEDKVASHKDHSPASSQSSNNINNGDPSKDTNGEDPASEPKVDPDSVTVVSNPTSIQVLVNKHFALPEQYDPSDLVYPNIPFVFKEKIEKRKMRKEAAEALEQLVQGAKADGIYIAGVSGFRSYATQKVLFDAYVKKDGLEKAKTYSAIPGTSEHETGLAIDVSGSTGKCAAQDCFADTPEAKWLADHASEYGFIVRYPKGKEDITGYQYEPWHIRYVGKKVSKEITSKDITLEEYLNEVPVSE